MPGRTYIATLSPAETTAWTLYVPGSNFHVRKRAEAARMAGKAGCTAWTIFDCNENEVCSGRLDVESDRGGAQDV